MPNSEAVASDLIASRVRGPRGTEATLDDASPVPTTSAVRTVSGGFRKLSRTFALTDGQLAAVTSAVLFVLAAWPLALTEVPPYQDLPNHLAAVTVIQNPEQYPEFVFNGFAKTNTALFAWLCLGSKLVGLKLAAKLFALFVLAMNAITIPQFVLSFTGSRKKMVVASLFAWPLVHNFFVSMGMLDFALGVPLSLALLIAIDRQRREPSWPRAIAVTALALATWYAHVFPLLVVHLLLLVEMARSHTFRADVKRVLAPLAPVSVLVCVSLYQHLRDTDGPMAAYVHNQKAIPAWELGYNLWAEWFWAFTKLELGTLIPCIGLGLVTLISFLRREKAPAFFSGWALLALTVLYVFGPYRVTNWYHVNSRFIPFLFFFMLLRVPDRLPKILTGVLGLAALSYSAAMGYDFVRLDEDRARFTAAMSVVPQNAKLLPLLFNHKGHSDNTRSLLHAWGFYVIEKHTSAPLLFAHSRSFPVMYASPPPLRFNHLVLEGFAPDMATNEGVCTAMTHVIPDDCNEEYKTRWAEFWRDALPRFDHVLLWDPTPQALALVPTDYKVLYSQGELVVLERADYAPRVAR